MSLFTNIIAEAHMAGQNDAGCKHASWGNARGHISIISEKTMIDAAQKFLEEAEPSTCNQQTKVSISLDDIETIIGCNFDCNSEKLAVIMQMIRDRSET